MTQAQIIAGGPVYERATGDPSRRSFNIYTVPDKVILTLYRLPDSYSSKRPDRWVKWTGEQPAAHRVECIGTGASTVRKSFGLNGRHRWRLDLAMFDPPLPPQMTRQEQADLIAALRGGIEEQLGMPVGSITTDCFMERY